MSKQSKNLTQSPIDGLTTRQYLVLESAERLIKAKPWPPTLAEISADTGFALGFVQYCINKLERKGWVSRQRGVMRSLQMLRALPAKAA